MRYPRIAGETFWQRFVAGFFMAMIYDLLSGGSGHRPHRHHHRR